MQLEPIVPTQVAHPRRASLRTAVAAIVGLVLLVNPIALVIIGVLNELLKSGVEIPPSVFVILNAVILITGAIIGGITRILLIPGVNEWITNYIPWLAPVRPIDTPSR